MLGGIDDHRKAEEEEITAKSGIRKDFRDAINFFLQS